MCKSKNAASQYLHAFGNLIMLGIFIIYEGLSLSL
jgi:hypothetical protein